jgi:phosphoglycerate dehydrogenase-like enzyme
LRLPQFAGERKSATEYPERDNGLQLRVAIFTPSLREPIVNALRADSELHVVEATDTAALLAALDGANVAIIPGASQYYTPEVGRRIEASKTLSWVHILSAGYEGVTAAGWPKGVTFTSSGGTLSRAVAEHAFAMLSTLSRQLDKAAITQTKAVWDRSQARAATILSGATLAVVGFGSIGQRIAKLARGYDMNVIGVSRSGRPNDAADEVHPASALLQVLPQAGAVISALPLSPETQHVFNAAAFARFKPKAFFVNVGRGGVVDQAALIAALRSGALAGAGLDVTDPEPLPKSDPLWSAPNLLISAHYAGAGDPDAGKRVATGLMENIRRFRAGEALLNQLSGS